MPNSEVRLDLSKPYTIELHGGPSDGDILRSDADGEQERQAAEMVLWMTENGTVGKGYKGIPVSTSFDEHLENRGNQITMTPDGPRIEGPPLQAHEYRVVDRVEEGGRIIIRLEYKAPGS